MNVAGVGAAGLGFLSKRFTPARLVRELVKLTTAATRDSLAVEVPERRFP